MRGLVKDVRHCVAQIEEVDKAIADFIPIFSIPKMGFVPWKFNILANKIVIYAIEISEWSALRRYSGNLTLKSAVKAVSCSSVNVMQLYTPVLCEDEIRYEEPDVVCSKNFHRCVADW